MNNVDFANYANDNTYVTGNGSKHLTDSLKDALDK